MHGAMGAAQTTNTDSLPWRKAERMQSTGKYHLTFGFGCEAWLMVLTRPFVPRTITQSAAMRSLRLPLSLQGFLICASMQRSLFAKSRAQPHCVSAGVPTHRQA